MTRFGSRPPPPTAALASPQDVLTFWFGACPPADAGAWAVRRQWFSKSDAFDADIRARFGPTIEAALAGRLDAWAQDPQGWLALIVVLDQFTRNVFRGTPRSFAGDARARALAEQGLAQDWDAELCWLARPFVLLPLEHSEDAATQRDCVTRFNALCAAAQAAGAASEVRELLHGNLDYALRHDDVIQRFGRFPHRNAILGRASTQAEQDYLAQPGAGF